MAEGGAALRGGGTEGVGVEGAGAGGGGALSGLPKKAKVTSRGKKKVSIAPEASEEARKRPESGAGNRVRTGDIQLGKLTLYQLSYARARAVNIAKAGPGVQYRRPGGERGRGARWI